MTTAKEIKEWFDRGVKDGKEFMVVAADTYDYEDYPVYCSKQGVQATVDSINAKDFGRVMEVYNLSNPFKSEGRVWEIPK